MVTGKGAPGVIPVAINTVKQEPNHFQPYRNTYQKHQRQPDNKLPYKPPYSQSNLNILSFPSQGDVKRPTLESIASHAAAQGREVTTPQQLLDMCCQFPACYDPLYQVILPFKTITFTKWVSQLLLLDAFHTGGINSTSCLCFLT